VGCRLGFVTTLNMTEDEKHTQARLCVMHRETNFTNIEMDEKTKASLLQSKSLAGTVFVGVDLRGMKFDGLCCWVVLFVVLCVVCVCGCLVFGCLGLFLFLPCLCFVPGMDLTKTNFERAKLSGVLVVVWLVELLLVVVLCCQGPLLWVAHLGV